MTRGGVRDMSVAGEPPNGKAEPSLPCEAAVAQQMGVDHTVAKIEAEARHENIVDLFPEESGVGFSLIVFHDCRSKEELAVES